MKILIFDAFNYIFRAYYASPAMTTKAGFPTNALHLFVTMVMSAIRKIQPDAIAVAFEPREGRKSLFRSRLYPEYKAQRSEPPEALVQQFPWFRPFVEALGLKAYDADGFEADDIIATLTRQATGMGHQVIIASSDKDLMQLIREDSSVTMVMDIGTKGGKPPKWATYADVIERFAVPPEKVADVLALAGDTIDNIPGCRGIGEKTAGKLISQFGSLEELMARLDEIKKPAQHNNLVEFSPRAAVSKQLTRLVFDVPVSLELKGLEPDTRALSELLDRFEMTKLKHELLGDSDVQHAPPADNRTTHPRPASLADNGTTDAPKLHTPPHAFGIMDSEDDLRRFLDDASRHHRIALWPVWDERDPQKLIALGIAHDDACACLFAPAPKQRSLFDCAPAEQQLHYINDVLDAVFQHKIQLAVVFGIKPFVKYAIKNHIEFDVQTWFDAEIAAYIIHPESAPSSFDDIHKLYLGSSCEWNPDTWLGTGKKYTPAAAQPREHTAAATSSWAFACLRLYDALRPLLTQYNLFDVYTTVDLPLAPVLAQMEYEGIMLDIDALKLLSDEYNIKLEKLEKTAFEYAGEVFNLNSPKQVGELLYKKLQLVPARKKKISSGTYSTDEETLESLTEQHALPRVILDYRAIAKLKSTYSDALAAQCDPATHRIHGKFNACVTATTRLSSSDPNLQNIPARDEEGRKIRRAFVARDGWVFVGADYSQIELRLMAACSREPALVDAFLAGVDVHAKTAAAIFDTTIHSVTRQQRQIGKTINFALLYGMGVQKLARETGYSTKEAKVFLEKFKAQFPVLSAWFDGQAAAARDSGETRTILGHRRVIPELYSENGMIKAMGERIALNAPIQGSASDIVKRAMLRFSDAVRRSGLHAKLLIQVHDELLVECPQSEAEQVADVLRDSMEHAADLCVPLAIDLRTGHSWADLK